MQFKLDENLPVEVAASLRHAGYDTKTVHDERLTGINDEAVAYACKSENRILVSLDADFSNVIAYPPEQYRGIIVLRVRDQGRNHVVEVFQSVLSALEAEPIDQHLWIVEESIIRIRGGES